jgi:hypothetical protein
VLRVPPEGIPSSSGGWPSAVAGINWVAWLRRTLGSALNARAALALDSGEPEWPAYSGALARKFLRLDQFLKESGVVPKEK